MRGGGEIKAGSDSDSEIRNTFNLNESNISGDIKTETKSGRIMKAKSRAMDATCAVPPVEASDMTGKSLYEYLIICMKKD